MKSKYTGLWLILAISLLIITIISFIDEVSIFGYKIKKAPIAENLVGQYLTVEERNQVKEQEQKEALKKAIAQENPVDTMPQSILVFGDSMTQNIARRIAAYAKQNGHTIHTVNWDSSGTRIWSSCDTLDYYINKFNPTYIFVSLGGNESGYQKPDVLIPNIQNIVNKMGEIPFVWIGPPQLKEEHGFNDMLLATLPSGTFFRSDGLTLERRKDKIHPTVEAAAQQVDSLMRWIKTSAHPIKVEYPVDSISDTQIKDTNIIYLKPKH